MSDISINDVVQANNQISQVAVTQAGVFWIESIAAEDSRNTIMHYRDGDIRDLTPGASVRSRVMEYGGGAYDVAQDCVVYCDDTTRQVKLLANGETRDLTPSSTRFRYGGLHLSLEHDTVFAVREDHEAPDEPRTEIVTLSLTDDNDAGGTVLVTGADFYAGPRVHGDQLAWFQWNHPNMSWDTAEVWCGPLTDISAAQRVAGEPGVAANHPMWLPDGTLVYVSDQSGFWNWSTAHTHWETAQDCSTPVWVLDRPAAAVVNDSELASVVITDGMGSLHVWNIAADDTAEILSGTTMIESVAAHDGVIYAIAEWPDRPRTLEMITAQGNRRTLVAHQPSIHGVTPRSVWADGEAGPVQSFFYPAAVSPSPLLVLTHGGPTLWHSASWDLAIQFWVSRGISVLDVNYSGSSGFGREYRDRLRGQWGVLDVSDAIAAVQHVVSEGLVDGSKVVITGGSAGGFTTLQALVTSDAFAAGMSLYGIADLTVLAHDTHKAESRYLDGLLGPYEEAHQVWVERSPITKLDSLTTPMLILQGTEDAVVPPNQAEMMADAVRSRSLPVALVMFEGEGHGFRNTQNKVRALEAQLSFVQQVLGLEHSADVPRLAIENL